MTTRQELRIWVMDTFRDPELDLKAPIGPGLPFPVPRGQGSPACRCYRCGQLLDLNTMTVDRIKPGVAGGTYLRNNVQPACKKCNTSMGGKGWHRRNRAH